MTPALRRLHWLNVGMQLVGVVFFTMLGLWPWVLWSVLFGAVSSAALYGERVRERGE